MARGKYDDATREQALAMCAKKGMTAAKVAKEMGIPRATVYNWVHTAEEQDEDFVAARREARRKLVKKAMGIVDDGLTAVGRQVRSAAEDRSRIDRLIAAVGADPYLDDDTRASIRTIVRDYAGVSMGDLTRAVKEAGAMESKFMDELLGKDGGPQTIQISFADMGEAAE